MKVSVVLATYNGEDYITEQLNSIIYQSRVPDEIIVVDDCSQDTTVSLVQGILANTNIQYKVIVNSHNIGWRRNFINGFHLAQGDIIFCADQDDIWHLDKIKKMEQALIEHNNINVLACNLKPLYEIGSTKLANYYIKEYGSEYIEKVSFSNQFLRVIRPGCTMCFRKTIIPYIDHIWREQLAHDEVLWAVGIVTDSLFIINDVLIDFRRHCSNNSPSNKMQASVRIERIKCNEIKLSNLQRYSTELNTSDEKKSIIQKLQLFYDKRKSAYSKKSIIDIIELLRYIDYYGGIKAWVADLISIYK